MIDLEEWLNQIAPSLIGYKHDDLHMRKNIPHDESRNAHAHLQALLLGNEVVVPFSDGKLLLGEYQEVIFVELDGPRDRQVVVALSNN